MQMKNYILILSIILASFTANACKNCGCRADKKSKSEHKHENDSQSHANVDLTESTVYWKGAKLTGSHEGTIDILSAHLHFNDKVFEGGEIIIDMKSINCTDLSGDSKKNIEGHLKDEDFFFSESSFNIFFPRVPISELREANVPVAIFLFDSNCLISFSFCEIIESLSSFNFSI